MAKQLLGKEVTAAMNERLQAKVAELKEKGVSPKLAIVRCGENPSDLSYERGATKRAQSVGVDVRVFALPEEDYSPDDLSCRIVNLEISNEAFWRAPRRWIPPLLRCWRP